MRKTIKRNANQYDTIRAMRESSFIGSQIPYFKNFINHHNLKNDLNSIKFISKYIFDNVYFEPDPPSRQQIRIGTRALREGIGNCVDYSVLLSQFLINLGVGHSFAMISTETNQPNSYNHIYVILDDYNAPIDLVIGQDQEGLNRRNRNINLFKEVPYYYKAKLKVI